MKLKLVLILLNIALYCSVTAQNSPFTTGFDKGFKEGYCYNRNLIYCQPPLTPLTPLPRLNESQNSYTDGYNRGFQTGLDLQRLEGGLRANNTTSYQNIPNYRFNDYIPQLPVDAMANELIYKQKLYDGRVNWIQQRINDMIDLAYSLVYQFSSNEYQNLVNQQTKYFKDNIEGKRINWADNYMFNQIKNFFNSQERRIYSTYNDLINQANSVIIDDELECNTFANPIYVIKQDNQVSFSITRNLADSLFENNYEFVGLLDDPEKKTGIVVFYVKSFHNYYEMDAQQYYHQQNNSISKMTYITSCDAVYIRNRLKNSMLIFYKGQSTDVKPLGSNTYKTPKNKYIQFSVYKDDYSNKRYYIPKEIFDNSIHNKIYSIVCK